MICPKCGTENKSKFKFCVKCGSNLENPGEVNIEQVDMGNYRSEEDYTSDKNSFKIGSGTFTISDRAPATNNGMFTAEELNDTDEEFDFSSYDEPFIPKLDADRLSMPSPNQGMAHQQAQPQQPFGAGGFPQQGMQQGAANQMMNAQQQMNGMMNSPQQQNMGAPMPNMGQGMPQQQAQPMNGMGMNPYMNQMYGAQQMYGQPMMAQPQIVGYDQNGMPIYGQAQPMMYAQPQIVGYDQNGMPIYGQSQPMMYAPPQIVGYDQNGMPIYGQAQPMMAQPQIVGYDQNGMPIYSQPQPTAMPDNGEQHNQQFGAPQQGMPQMMGAMPQMGGMPGAMPMQGQPMNGMYGAPQQNMQAQAQQQPKQPGQVKVSNEFWNNFFAGEGDKDGGDDGDGQDDFFSKPRHDAGSDMGSVSAAGMDMNRLKKHERKKNTYMTDTPDVNAEDLKPNKLDAINKRYMRGAVASVDADQLVAKTQSKKQDIMEITDDVDAGNIEVYERKKANVVMTHADEANADDLKAYEHEHVEAIMDQADHAVEALPKKKATVEDEIDAIELPEYMQARKTVRNDTPEIPGLPEI